jgi:hypothetical protein
VKLLYLTNGYPPHHTAGTESYTAALAGAFAQAGHTVRVVCGGDWDSGPLAYNGRQQTEQAGVVVDRLNLNWTRGADPNGALFDNPATEAVVAEILASISPISCISPPATRCRPASCERWPGGGRSWSRSPTGLSARRSRCGARANCVTATTAEEYPLPAWPSRLYRRATQVLPRPC